MKKGARASFTTRTGALATIFKRSGNPAMFLVAWMDGGAAGAMWELQRSCVAYGRWPRLRKSGRSAGGDLKGNLADIEGNIQ